MRMNIDVRSTYRWKYRKLLMSNRCEDIPSHCGAQVDACGTHNLVCKQAPGKSICFSWFSSFEGARRPQPCRWETHRWHDTDSMAGRQAGSLGCDCHSHDCRLICRGIGMRVRRSSRNCSHAQRGQVFQSTITVHLLPNSH